MGRLVEKAPLAGEPTRLAIEESEVKPSERTRPMDRLGRFSGEAGKASGQRQLAWEKRRNEWISGFWRRDGDKYRTNGGSLENSMAYPSHLGVVQHLGAR